VSSSPCRAELLTGADEQERGIYGGDPPGGEDAVYAAKARAADADGGTVGVLGGALRATGTDGPICPDCECWPARRAPLSPMARVITPSTKSGGNHCGRIVPEAAVKESLTAQSEDGRQVKRKISVAYRVGKKTHQLCASPVRQG
jgi:hypothetical protein